MKPQWRASRRLQFYASCVPSRLSKAKAGLTDFGGTLASFTGARNRKNASPAQLPRHPIRRFPAIFVEAVMGAVIAVFDHEELGWAFGLAGEALGVFWRTEPVEPRGDDEERAINSRCHAFEGEREGFFLGLGLVGAVAAAYIGVPREPRQLLPQRAPIVGAAIGDGRFDALLEGDRARRVITAESDAPDAHAVCVDFVAQIRLEPIDHGRDDVLAIVP